MGYALVSFAFAGNHFEQQLYVFKTGVVGLKKGDLVLVESDNKKGYSLAMFEYYMLTDEEAERFPEKEFIRKTLIKKAHKNMLNSLIRIRILDLKDIKIADGVYKCYRKSFRNNKGLSEIEIRKKLIRNMSVAAEPTRIKDNGITRYRFGLMCINVRDNCVIEIAASNKKKMKWTRPEQLELIAEEFIEKLGL
ncbi:hypothetical protein ACQKII_07595 [Lysinibacillus sp. NPDC048646]|uniref:hypothetical protein n=1 Tax=Lysinibacillus sp. NPDC048646 TaxID=3390574 RepID=UPI003D02EA31